MQFYEKLQILRKQAGLTQGELAEKLSVSRQAISKWESGSSYPDIKKIRELCILFGTDPDTLLDPKIEEIRCSEESIAPFDPLMLGANLKRVRSARGMGQEMLAELLGVSRQSISKWETGLAFPKTEVLLCILRTLKTDFAELFQEDNATVAEAVPQKEPNEAQESPLLTPVPSMETEFSSEKAEEETASKALEDASTEELPCPPQSKASEPTYQRKRSPWLLSAILLSLSLLLILSLAIGIPLLRKKRGTEPPPPEGETSPSDETTDPSTEKKPPKIGLPWSGETDVSWYNPEDTEFTLYTPEELAGLAELVNSGTDLFEGKTIRLGANIDLSSTSKLLQWTPIGGGSSQIASDSSLEELLEQYGALALEWMEQDGEASIPSSFRGSFLGEGRKIMGLYLDTTDSYVGLFGLIWGGSVQDLDLEVTYLKGTNAVGGVCGAIFSREGYESAIVDCKVTATSLNGESHVGAIAGVVRAYGQSIPVTKCQSSGYIKGYSYTGGILGYGESRGEDCILTLSQCKNTAELVSRYRGSSTPYSIVSYFGGMAGYTCAQQKGTVQISRCENTGKICFLSSGQYVGGIAGAIVTEGTPSELGYTTVSDCGNLNNICSESYHSSYVGGIVGLARSANIEISYCYNAGKLAAEKNCGGICGVFYNQTPKTVISHCAFTGSIYSSRSDSTTSSNYEVHSFGGIVGIFYNLNSREVFLSDCYVNGIIEADLKGGLIGAFPTGNGIIENCGFAIETSYDYLSYAWNISVRSSDRYSWGTMTEEIIYRDKIQWNPAYWNPYKVPPRLIFD